MSDPNTGPEDLHPGRGLYPFFDKDGEYIETWSTTGDSLWFVEEVGPMKESTTSAADERAKSAPVVRREFTRMCICYALPRDPAPERWWVYVENGGESKVFCRFTLPGNA